MIKLFDKDMHEIVFNITDYQLSILPLDNFSAFGLEMDGIYFQTSEHAFQFLKFFESNPQLAKKIKDAYSPNEARRIAQENRQYKNPDWSNLKYDYMEKVLRLKVQQNPVVMKKLLSTKDNIIAEYCTDEDTDWGLDNDNRGQNNLGRIWMKIRDELKEK